MAMLVGMNVNLPSCWAEARINVAEALLGGHFERYPSNYNWHIIAHTWHRWKEGITRYMAIGEI